MSWEPIDHKSPLPRIDINPRVPVTHPAAQTFWEIQAEHDEKARLKRESERIWGLVRSIGEGTGVA